jgi:predicted AlkP superfamily pyrophosphatase or phosphodiesterase
MLAEAAAETIRLHRPNLVAIHFLKTDVVQHTFGPGHYLAKAAMTETDHHIGLLREAVRQAGIESSTTFIITADHGFQAVNQEISLYAPFHRAGLSGKVRLHPDKWVMFVEREKSFQPSDGSSLTAALTCISTTPGIYRIVPSSQFAELGQPRYEEDIHIRGQFMILANIDYFLTNDPSFPTPQPHPKKRPYFGHGYLPQNPRMYPMLVLEGNSIAVGKRIGHVHQIDLAPTIGRLLDLDWRPGPGRILNEALAQPESALRRDSTSN